MKIEAAQGFFDDWDRLFSWKYIPLRMWEFLTRGMWLEVKWFFQRGKRGWADCDVWGMDLYITDIVIPMLKRLKKIKHGIPADFVSGDDTDILSEGEKKWETALELMIVGFEAHRAQYNLFLKDFKSIAELRAASAALEKARSHGMNMFVKYFSDLWD